MLSNIQSRFFVLFDSFDTIDLIQFCFNGKFNVIIPIFTSQKIVFVIDRMNQMNEHLLLRGCSIFMLLYLFIPIIEFVFTIEWSEMPKSKSHHWNHFLFIWSLWLMHVVYGFPKIVNYLSIFFLPFRILSHYIIVFNNNSFKKSLQMTNYLGFISSAFNHV